MFTKQTLDDFYIIHRSIAITGGKSTRRNLVSSRGSKILYLIIRVC